MKKIYLWALCASAACLFLSYLFIQCLTMPLIKILVTPQTLVWNSETEKYDQIWTMGEIEKIGKFVQIESMIAIALSLIVFFGVVFVGRRNKRCGAPLFSHQGLKWKKCSKSDGKDIINEKEAMDDSTPEKQSKGSE